MKNTLFWNDVLAKGAILGGIMLCSHIFEQCATIYGGTMTWYTMMGVEMIVAAAAFVWLIYYFTKRYSVAVMQPQQVKMFSYGAGLGYAASVSIFAGIIVGLGRYILHSFVIGHKAYVNGMIDSLQQIIEGSPEMAAMGDMYNQMLAQIATQPEPSIFATIGSTVWSYMLWGVIVGLFVAGIVKKEPQLFDNNNNNEAL